jgi:CRISPR system Cascade subunit CasD
MRSVLLRLEGPLQSWSTQGKLGVRDTDREPGKGAVLGLVGAALGMARDDDAQLTELRSLSFAVRVDRPGTLLRDYHTAGGGSFRGRADYLVFGAEDCIPSERYYLQNACFTAALGGDDALVERVAGALRSPRWPLFLGRRSCAPSSPVFLAVVDGPPRDALREPAHLYQPPGFAPADARARPTGPARVGDPARAPERLRLIVEATPDEGGDPRYDDPLSFREGRRRYGVRYVRVEWFEPPAPSSAETSP